MMLLECVSPWCDLWGWLGVENNDIFASPGYDLLGGLGMKNLVFTHLNVQSLLSFEWCLLNFEFDLHKIIVQVYVMSVMLCLKALHGKKPCNIIILFLRDCESRILRTVLDHVNFHGALQFCDCKQQHKHRAALCVSVVYVWLSSNFRGGQYHRHGPDHAYCAFHDFGMHYMNF